MRVLIIAHGHPALSAGGGERAAYSLFQHLKTKPEFADTCFAARAPHALIGHDALFGSFRGKRDELLVSVPEVDHFTYQTADLNKLSRIINDLLDHVRPDVVHVHHFAFFGLEIFRIIKEAGIPIVFTVHEFLLMCHNNGQMVKTSGGLCHFSSPLECSQCFPHWTPGLFFLRAEMIQYALSYADALIAPSRFLGERFASWGFHQESINVIENPLSPEMLEAASAARRAPEEQRRNGSGAYLSLGFFGQIHPYKGIDVLLEALRVLPAEIRSRVTLGLHGANLELQTEIFQSRIRSLLAELDGTVMSFGPYDNSQVVDLMKSYHRIVVPSIWWENSPVVIQESKLAGVPLLCSDLGGMAEKADGPEDVRFLARSPSSLAAAITTLVTSPDRPTTDIGSLIADHRSAVQEHMYLYRDVLDGYHAVASSPRSIVG